MTTKLIDNASLGEVMTVFENIKGDLQISKNNIVNAIGSPATLNDKLSVIPSKITSVLTEKNNIIGQLSQRKRWAKGNSPVVVIPEHVTTNPITGQKGKTNKGIKLNLDFVPSVIIAYSYDVSIYNNNIYDNNYSGFRPTPSKIYLNKAELTIDFTITNCKDISFPVSYSEGYFADWIAYE
ncbi:hypothetical protein C4R89_02720 [Clostridioides difficile]|nr:hypothetical protein [Clostridioides difficile]MDB0438450.1 hypothetical protein [Clostridioides difficile]